MTSICTLLVLVVACQWPLYQMDVKNTFLNSNLSDIVYIQPPLGIIAPPGHICRFRRALSGLKHEPHVWYVRFCQSFPLMVIHGTWLTMRCFGALLFKVLCFSFYMLMTWLLLEVMLSLLHF